MTDYELEISPGAPTDDEGHPIHPDPDKSHRICAAQKSERTTPTEHGRERDDVPYCTLAAGWGVDDKSEGTCSHHLGAVDNRGENNPNYEHGAFSEYFESNMTETEAAAVEDLATTLVSDDEDRKRLEMARVAAKAWQRFERSNDHRFLREYRQICSEFNLGPDSSEKVEGTFEVESTTEVELDDETQEVLDDLTGGI